MLAANTPMLLRAGLVEGRLDAGVLSSGQVAGVIDDLPTVAELIARIMAEAEADVEAIWESCREQDTRSAVEGWFTHRRGRARSCSARAASESGSYFWPTAIAASGNPSAPGEEREPVELSRRGRLWSWTTNHYAPPEPYVAPDPFVPYTVCAVELDAEQMVVLGQLATGADADAARGRHGDGAGARPALRGRRARVRRVAVGTAAQGGAR